MKRISTFSQVTFSYYTTKHKEVYKGKTIKEEVAKEEKEDNASLSLTTSDMVDSICHSQLSVVNKTFEIDLITLYNEYSFVKNCNKRNSYHTTFSDQEKLCIMRK